MPSSAGLAIDATPVTQYTNTGCPYNDSCQGSCTGTNIATGAIIRVRLMAHGNFYCENLPCSPNFNMNCDVVVKDWTTIHTNTSGATEMTVHAPFSPSGDSCGAFEAAGPCSLPGDWVALNYRLGIRAQLVVGGSVVKDVIWWDATSSQGGH